MANGSLSSVSFRVRFIASPVSIGPEHKLYPVISEMPKFIKLRKINTKKIKK